MDDDDDWDFDAAKAEWNKRRTTPFNFDQWCKDLEMHPAFMTGLSTEGQYSEAVEALQAMKYDSESSLEEQAASFKTDGNVHFKKKNYQQAILAYTEGIKLKCNDKNLNVDLFNNRSASHFYLKNFRSAFKDCLRVRRLDPSHTKIFKRGLDCLSKLNCPVEILKWIDETDPEILNCQPNIRQIKSSALQCVKLLEKQKRQNYIKQRRSEKEKVDLIESFKVRNLAFKEMPENQLEKLDLKYFEIDLPQCTTVRRVFLDPDSNSLVWPVLFLYPEHNTTDFVEEFDENSRFLDHFNVLLSDVPTWDIEGSYKIERIEMYFESFQCPDTLVMVPLSFTLKETLSQSRRLAD